MINKTISFPLIAVMSTAAAITIIIIAGGAQATITCDTVKHDADRCLYYAVGTDTKILDECCQGLRRLKQTATTLEDKTAVCTCLSDAIKSGDLPVTGKRMKDISKYCKVKAPFKLATNLDCTKNQVIVGEIEVIMNTGVKKSREKLKLISIYRACNFNLQYFLICKS
ncbi:Non-specific lipid-transfer protein C, cotyledon-specific isoform [Linum perenne]